MSHRSSLKQLVPGTAHARLRIGECQSARFVRRLHVFAVCPPTQLPRLSPVSHPPVPVAKAPSWSCLLAPSEVIEAKQARARSEAELTALRDAFEELEATRLRLERGELMELEEHQ
eukprot:scaffold76004_cov23-Tisochrysis_lutea.AAC.1